jgi:hypothetical protein
MECGHKPRTRTKTKKRKRQWIVGIDQKHEPITKKCETQSKMEYKHKPKITKNQYVQNAMECVHKLKTRTKN